MTLTFKKFLSESIDDKGILKAVFVVGIPGAGKSHTITQLKGTISPRVVNTDRASEYLAKKFKKPVNDTTWPLFQDDAQRITTSTLYNYLNGMLPLFIDGTSNDVSNILGRAGILESLGYDVGMIFIEAPLDVAIKRAQARAKKVHREVDIDFIRQVHKISDENKDYFQEKFKFFKEVHNVGDLLDDAMMSDVFKHVQGFYSQPVENPVGKRLIEEMRDKKLKFLVPDIFTKDALKKKLDSWYRN